MVVVGAGSTERTLLMAVNRVLGQCGENEESTVSLGTPTRRVMNAWRAVEDARDEIFYDRLWDWRRGFFDVNLVVNQMWYELPVDYQKMAQFLSRNSKVPIPYLNYNNLIGQWPELRLFPPGSGVGDVTSALQAAAQTNNIGTPEVYTVWNGYLGMIPIPDANFLDTEDSVLYATYWKDATPLASDNDLIGLPRSLWMAHHNLAMSLFKKSIEAPDWQLEKQDGLRQLHEQSASAGEDQDMDNEHGPSINYNE